MRIAVTGCHGQVASSLINRANKFGIEVIPLSRPNIDLARPDTILEPLSLLDVNLVVNAAAFTSVDLAESQSELAFAINHRGAEAVARAAATLRIPIIHLSTDYVFDGTLDRPYAESDSVNPINVYGHSKLAGERAVAAMHADHVILRTAWVYSPFGKNFVRTMLSLANHRPNVSVVADQLGAPTNAMDIADAIFAMGRKLLEKPDAPELRGLFHMTGGGEATWADFAQGIFEELKSIRGSVVGVVRTTTDEFPTPAKRPANSRLDCSKLAATYGLRLAAWQQSLQPCVKQILEETQG